MDAIRVEVAALQAAAGVIADASDSARFATGRIRTASEDTGAFGGEPAGEAFLGACTRAIGAVEAIGDVLDQLSTNTSAAAMGYLVTDEGAIPSSFGLHGAIAYHQGNEQPHAEAQP
jgi:uncharacterized protein YukE